MPLFSGFLLSPINPFFVNSVSFKKYCYNVKIMFLSEHFCSVNGYFKAYHFFKLDCYVYIEERISSRYFLTVLFCFYRNLNISILSLEIDDKGNNKRKMTRSIISPVFYSSTYPGECIYKCKFLTC